MATTLLALTIYTLVVARISRLITLDKITEPIRARVTARFGPKSLVTYWIHCTWCASIPVAAVLCVPAAAVAGLPLWWAPALALAASQVTGMLTRWDAE